MFKRRQRLSMVATLTLAFGGMMTLALAIVIIGSFVAAGKNTRDLLVRETNLILNHLEDEVEAFLEPAEHTLEVVASELAEHQGSLDDLDPVFRGVEEAIPQLVGIGLIDQDRHVRFLGKVPPGSPSRFQTIPRHDFDAATRDVPVGQIYWVDPIWTPLIDDTLLTARKELPDGAGFVATGVRLEAFSKHIGRIGAESDREVFVLHGNDSIVGYSDMEASNAITGPESPLPTIDMMKPTALARIWSADNERLDWLDDDENIEAHWINHDGKKIGFVYRQVAGFAALPWIVGIHFDLDESDEEVDRLKRSGSMALIISAVAILITLRLGRKLSQPIERLAERAQAIQGLATSDVTPLPRSRIAELDHANRAFNAMGAALNWFQAYLPKRLVSQLMTHGSPEDVLSEEREITVMFTDIVGFSSRAALLSPSETAAFLNEHFAALEACIDATDGTIDKYIGDGLLAFWGAPQHQPDHARRALDAALAVRERLAGGDVAMRIGLHCGSVLVGNIGAPGRLNYTLVGDTVNLAQRIEQAGKTLGRDELVTIIASRAFADHVDTPAEPCGETLLRGQSETIELVRF